MLTNISDVLKDDLTTCESVEFLRDASVLLTIEVSLHTVRLFCLR